MTRPLRTLLFSTLYPSSVRPVHGVFVETRLRELLATGDVQTKVLAPVPWFPFTAARFGERARMAATPAREQRHGIDVLHPRYPLLPKVGMTVAPALLALASLRPVARLLREGFDFDVIDAHYYYPDGVAAVMLARHFGKPVTITARGSDINLLSQFTAPRLQMQWAARRADASIGVCNDLAEKIRAWTDGADRVAVMRNGVDLQRFAPGDPGQARAHVRCTGQPLLLSVGNLVDLKGHDLVIDALAELLPQWPGARLAIVGDGPLRQALTDHAARRGLADRVDLIGRVAPEAMAAWYQAADLLVLASSREGWANVLLEAMACGTPVVATRVGGSPEVVREAVAGRLVGDRSGPALAAALAEVLRSPPERAAVRRYAEGFSWQATSQAQLSLFRRLAAASPRESALA
jgi:teichuronic acid biosynthesis glycosyltransferase TuaC